MKILATFDRSKCSEAILPELEWMAQLPDVEFTFLTIARRPRETAKAGRSVQETAGLGGVAATTVIVRAVPPTLIEDQSEAIARTVAEGGDYLREIVSRMPPGPKYNVDAKIDDDVGGAIVRYAMEHQPDVIVMGTHGETGMIHRLFGDTAEGVVRSGVAPVLLVHADRVRRTSR